MGKYILGALCAVLLSACVTVNLPSKEYQIGDVFTDRVYVGPTGSYAPLPEGDWELIGKGRVKIGSKTYTKLWLAQFKDGQLTGFIKTETADYVFNNGAPLPKYCKDEGYYYIDVRNRTSISSLENDCLILRHEVLKDSFYAENFEKQALQNLQNKVISLPVTLTGIHFVKTNKTSALEVEYYRNPVLDGFQDDVLHIYKWSESKWYEWRLNTSHQAANIPDQAERKAYYDEILTWAQQWEPKVKFGFWGEDPE